MATSLERLDYGQGHSKAIKYPTAAKDDLGRLRVAAAIGATGDFKERADELVKARVDCLVIDTAHGIPCV